MNVFTFKKPNKTAGILITHIKLAKRTTIPKS